MHQLTASTKTPPATAHQGRAVAKHQVRSVHFSARRSVGAQFGSESRDAAISAGEAFQGTLPRTRASGIACVEGGRLKPLFQNPPPPAPSGGGVDQNPYAPPRWSMSRVAAGPNSGSRTVPHCSVNLRSLSFQSLSVSLSPSPSP